ncbi:type II toxin-antitoxin system RelE/ParE family toxin [Phyllobacterium sp. SB3]|uniref:type II toxin-antitoxin system RelE/ParE family toxin n=1 Tax=Phyllobacterium sp. SB3 TaxID=3156073 RepID=UPI0032AED711
MDALPPGLQARLIRLMEMVESIGLDSMREPHVKHIDGKLWELRAKAAEGIARGLYIAVAGRRVVILHVFVKKNAADTTKCSGSSLSTDEAGGNMKTLGELKKKYVKDPEFRKHYKQADREYAVIELLIRTRTQAKLSQAELAKRMATTQSAIARLEGGKVSPSIATLRRYAEATGYELRVDMTPL